MSKSMDLGEILYVAPTCWFVEAHAKFSLHSNIQGRDLCWYDFMKYMFKIIMCQTT